jgi:hypothetical protein
MVHINLSPDEMQALKLMARQERRYPGPQAALIIRRELKRRGLLPKHLSTAQPSAAQPMNNQA